MAIDLLKAKVRKCKNPIALDLCMSLNELPPHIIETSETALDAYSRFCMELLAGLKTIVPAVRFNFNMFALAGNDGLTALEHLATYAKNQGYYVLLDGVQSLSVQSASFAASTFLAENCPWYFDGLILSSYIGSDGLKPYISGLKQTGKDLFVVVRTSNKSASELQDLLAGGRLVHVANTDIVNRYADSLVEKSGYSQLAIMAAASSADSLRTLRTKYKNLFMLLDGYDYPNANAKNCSFAFDELGYGAVACAGLSITCAWRQAQTNGTDFVEQAVWATERLKKNLFRYISIF